MKHLFIRKAALLLALLLALSAMAGAAGATGAISNVSISDAGIITWDPFPGAGDDYMLDIDGIGSYSASGTDLKARIEELLADDSVRNTPTHHIELTALHSLTMDHLAEWTGTFAYLSPNYPEYSVPTRPLKDTAKIASGTLSWEARSTDTVRYAYEVAAGGKSVSNITTGLSVDINAYIDDLITAGDLPYAKSFTIRLYAIDAANNTLDSHTIDNYAYVPTVALIDIDDPSTSVSGIEDAYTHTGAPIEPAVTAVFVGGKPLTKGTDYAVSYENNVEVGIGCVVLTGMGRYTGVSKAPFNIVAAPKPGIDAAIAADGTLSWSAYPGATGYSYGVEGVFLTASAPLAVDLNALIDGFYDGGSIPFAAAYTVTLHACDENGNTLQSWSKSYAHTPVIVPKDIAGATVAAIPDQPRTGSPITPALNVIYGSLALAAGADYTVTYADNVEVGTATATLTGIGGYAGTKAVTFAIVAADPDAPDPSAPPAADPDAPDPSAPPASDPGAPDPSAPPAADPGAPDPSAPPAAVQLSACKLSATDLAYTGKALKPAVTCDGAALLEGTDYAVVSCKNNTNPGVASVTIEGRGGYAGTATLRFRINPKSVALSRLSPGRKKITVTWKKQTKKVSGYQLQYGTKKSFKGAKNVTIKGAKTAKKTLTGLKAKTKYYVRVRTWYRVKGKTYYSAWSKAKSVKTK